jgi:major membrane immunogen (membrane-anchored lipoprotein)
MKISRNTFILSLISSVSLFACGDKKKKGEQTVVWNAMVARSAAQAAPEGLNDGQLRMSVISDDASWDKLWSVVLKGTRCVTPQADFKNQLAVVVSNVKYLNEIKVLESTKEADVHLVNLELIRTALPVGEKVHMVVMLVPRANTKAVQVGSMKIKIQP